MDRNDGQTLSQIVSYVRMMAAEMKDLRKINEENLKKNEQLNQMILQILANQKIQNKTMAELIERSWTVEENSFMGNQQVLLSIKKVGEDTEAMLLAVAEQLFSTFSPEDNENDNQRRKEK